MFLAHCGQCVRRNRCAIEDMPLCLVRKGQTAFSCKREFASSESPAEASVVTNLSTATANPPMKTTPSLPPSPINSSNPPALVESQYMGVFLRTPQSFVWFSSPDGRKILTRSISVGSAESYFPLSEQFLTQATPPSCGPATLAMVLNSLRIDPGRVWRSPWRWFTEEMLLSCVPTGPEGTTMEHFALMAECNGATAQTFYGSRASEDMFRSLVRQVTAQDGQRLVVCFDREGLGQTGTGHYSPIAAYDKDTDMVLVLDVARFKYPPYWVPVKDLFNAMKTEDPCTGRSRGFFVVRQAEGDVRSCGHATSSSSSSCCSTSDSESCSCCTQPPVSERQRPRPGASSRNALDRIKDMLTSDSEDQLKGAAAAFVHELRLRSLDFDTRRDLEIRLDVIRRTPLYAAIKRWIANSDAGFLCRQDCAKSKFCSKDLIMVAPGGCIAALVSVGLERPVDYFLRSVPQETAELLALMLIEQGGELLGEPDYRCLLTMLKGDL